MQIARDTCDFASIVTGQSNWSLKAMLILISRSGKYILTANERLCVLH